MFGNVLLKSGRRGQKRDISEYPVLSDYMRAPLPANRRWMLTLGFFVCSLIIGYLFATLPTESKFMMVVPLLLMAMFVVWLLPETGRPPTTILTRLFFAYFIALVLWPYYLAIQIPGAPLIEIRRVLLLLSTFFLLVCFSVSDNFNRTMKEIMGSRPFFFKVFAGFFVAQVLSLAATLNFNVALMAFIRNQLGWTVVLFIAMYVMSKPGRVLIFANIVRLMAVGLAILAILEFRNGGILWANHIPSFLQVSDPAMVKLLSPVFRAGEYRVTGTFSVSLCFAEFLALTLPFFLHYLMVGKNLLFKIIIVVCDLLVINAILLTQARVGLVCMAVVHGIYFFIWSLRLWRTHKNNVFGPALMLGYPVMLVVFGLAMTFIGRLRGMWLGGAEEGASNIGRLEQMAKTPAILARRPLFGYGPSQGGRALGHTNQAGDLSIDSSLLSIPLDYGVVGFICYCTMFIYMLVQGMKLASEATDKEGSYAMPLAVVVAAWLTSRIVLSQEDNASFMYMILGALVALAYQRRKQKALEETGNKSVMGDEEFHQRERFPTGLGGPGRPVRA
ncbi:MAG: O-antigen ligase family protein [Sphingobium sp.]